MSTDASYYAARAIEERRLAMASANENVRRVHLEMAAKYAVLAGADAGLSNETAPETEQRAG